MPMLIVAGALLFVALRARANSAQGGEQGIFSSGESIVAQDSEFFDAQPPSGEGALSVDQDGINFLKEREGFSPTPYWDHKGYSIGYGHFLRVGENFEAITQDLAEQLLLSDLAWAQNAILDFVIVPLSQNQFNALLSFIYNVGEGGFLDSTLRKKLNAGDYSGAADELLRWNKARDSAGNLVVNDGLVARRELERELFIG